MPQKTLKYPDNILITGTSTVLNTEGIDIPLRNRFQSWLEKNKKIDGLTAYVLSNLDRTQSDWQQRMNARRFTKPYGEYVQIFRDLHLENLEFTVNSFHE